jgi:hypothetical protein
MTEVIITAFMKEPAALAPAIWKTMVKGEVEEDFVDRPG